jgi:hypothetical protein
MIAPHDSYGGGIAAQLVIRKVKPTTTVVLALQLQLPFQVGLLGFGLVAAAPDGPCDDEGRFDPALG